MKNLKIILTLLVGSAFFSGCALKQMIKVAHRSDLALTPSPLEVHGGKVPYQLTATLPPKILPSGKIYTIYTIYQYDDQSITVGSVVLNADDYPNSSIEPTHVNESFSFDYSVDMNPGKLVMVGEAKDPKNGETKMTDTLSLAQGFVLTSQLVEDTYYSSFAGHGYVAREELIPTRVNFYFDQGRSDMNMSLSVDGAANRDKSVELSAFIAEKNVTRTVTITGTHSPEGSETLNTNLADDRARAIEKIYRVQMRKYDYTGIIDSIQFIPKPVIQDWSALKSALASYDGISSDAKLKMNQIIDGNGLFQDKEKALQGVEGYDKVFDEVYPTLRSAQTHILTVKEKKTPAEIAVLARQVTAGEVSADTLSMEEILFAAEQSPSLGEKIAIYSSATRKGKSWIAHNNLAATYLEMAIAGDKSKIADALTQLEIASNLNGGASHIAANIGAAYIMQGEYDQAYDALSNAAANDNAVNARVNSMKGTIEVRRGEYEAAVSSFGTASNDGRTNFDKGLAYLLSGDYTQAVSAFEAAQDDDKVGARAYYLSAVTAARQGVGPNVASNLMEAVKRDPDLKESALNDLEFRDYANQVAQVAQ